MGLFPEATASAEVASHEVATRAVWAVVRMLERGEISTAKLFDGLPYDVTALKGKRRLPWDDYVTICDNLLGIAGDWQTLDDLVEDGYHEVIPELRSLARALIEPRSFMRFVLEVLNPMVWPAVHSECTDLEGDDLRVTIRLRPGARPNPTFIRVSVPAIRGITRHLELPPAKVLHTDVGPVLGVIDVRLPRSRTLLRRVGRASLGAINRVTASLLIGDGEVVDPLETRLDEATVTWALSRRQIEVLRLLVQGQSNKEIAQSSGCAENTVELHVTQLLRKASASSRAQLIARFWAED